jgi:hypothetical protein
MYKLFSKTGNCKETIIGPFEAFFTKEGSKIT